MTNHKRSPLAPTISGVARITTNSKNSNRCDQPRPVLASPPISPTTMLSTAVDAATSSEIRSAMRSVESWVAWEYAAVLKPPQRNAKELALNEKETTIASGRNKKSMTTVVTMPSTHLLVVERFTG